MTDTPDQPIRDAIEAFRERHGLGRGRAGMYLANDPSLLNRLEKGRVIRPDTERKLREQIKFMDSFLLK
jgi:hypothetical protein